MKMRPNTTKGTSCRPSLFLDNGQNSVQNIRKINGNTDFVNVVFPKVSLQFLRIWYHWKACYTAKISIFSKLDKNDVPFVIWVTNVLVAYF